MYPRKGPVSFWGGASKFLGGPVSFQIYWPPGHCIHKLNVKAWFNKEFTEFLSRLQKTKGEVVIVGDFNIDLLKVEHKPKTKDYLDSIMTQGFFPKITLPTRFSEMNGTLIDNVLCRLSNTSINNDAGIIVTQLSDHLPYFICLRTMKVDKPEPKYIYIKQTTETSMNRVKHEIITASIYDKLNTHEMQIQISIMTF